MATGSLTEVMRHVRKTLLSADGAGVGDGQLLEWFIQERDEAAFEALVRRHGAMVLGVCRRVLRHPQDAEDAFQASFLVLVRKAASIVPRAMVANWLYGVAYQTALKARSLAARRGTRERQVTQMPEPIAAAPNDLWPDLQPLLDQELSRLPDKYRVPIVLCDLENKTRKEAARQLGWPEGTVASRLMRGRQMLARRLGQRGFVASGGILAGILAQNSASAGLSASLVMSTVKAAALLAAGQSAAGVVSVAVAALTEGVLKTMLLSKLKVLTVLLLTMGACTVGGVGVVGRSGIVGSAQGAAHPARPQDDDNVVDRKRARELEDLDSMIQSLRRKAEKQRQELAQKQALLDAKQAMIAEKQVLIKKLEAELAAQAPGKTATKTKNPQVLDLTKVKMTIQYQQRLLAEKDALLDSANADLDKVNAMLDSLKKQLHERTDRRVN